MMLRHGTTTKRKPTFDDRWLKLLDSAAAEFAAVGYEGASMRRLASEAELSLSGVYHYVGSKEELLYWIQFNTFDSLLQGLQTSVEGIRDPRQRLHAAVLNHVRHFGRHMNELKVCAREIGALKGEAYQAVHDVRLAYFEAVHALVKALSPQPEGALDSWLATANLFGMMNWFYQWYDRKRSRVSLDDLAAQQTALFLKGYAASNGDDRSDA